MATAAEQIVDVVTPAAGESVSEGTILEWHVKVGDFIKANDTIVEISTDKVDIELPAPASGTVTEILIAEGETVTVRLCSGEPEPRRVRGVVGTADAEAVVLEGPEVPGGTMRLPYGVIERARTVFEWGAAPAPTPSRGKAGKGKERVQTS